MPPVSQAQRAAMHAAAEGRSTLGIPASVGREFAAADPGGKLPGKAAKDLAPRKWDLLRRLFGEWLAEEAGELEHGDDALASAPNSSVPAAATTEKPKGRAASVLFITPKGDCLFVKRAADEENWPNTWSLPGGKADGDEALDACAAREAREEVGRDCALDDMVEMDNRRTPHGWDHATYAVRTDEFEPKLNGEHSEHVWRHWSNPPKPLHPGVGATLESLGDRRAAEDQEFRRVPGGEEPAVSLTDLLPYAERQLHSPDSPSQGKDMAPEKWSLLRRLFGQWLEEEQEEPEHAAADEDVACVDIPLAIRLMEYAREDAPDDEALHRVAERLTKLGDGRTLTMEDYDALMAADEPADPSGKLSETTRSEIDSTKHREDMPAGAFLGPDRTYPVKEQRDGEWKYTRDLLLAAARRARMQGRGDIARRADAIREREFGAAEDAGTAHDPSTGRFTSGQHLEAAENHSRKADEHRQLSGNNRLESPHSSAKWAHLEAMQAHRKAAKNPKFAEFAHQRTKHANSLSEKLKAGTDESFAKVEHSLAHKKGVHDPAALAAHIGREHGKIKGGDVELAPR